MSFARFKLKAFSQPNLRLAPSVPADAEGGTSDDSNTSRRELQASESIATIRRRPWKAKRPSATGHSSPSMSTPIPPSTSKAGNPTNESRVDTLSPSDPVIPHVHPTNIAVIPSPEAVPAIGAEPDKLADAWGAVKDGPKVASTGRARDADGVFSATSLFFYCVLNPHSC